MSKGYVENTLNMILTKDEKKRIKVTEKNKKVQVSVDMHGMTASDAKRFLNNLVVMIRGEFELKIIHGYTHGTVIKEIIWNEYQNSKIKKRIADVTNLGVTYLSVAM